MFGRSEEDRIVDTAETVTAAVRDELFGDIDVQDLRRDLEKHAQQFRPASPKEIREALRDLLDETDIQAIVEHGEGPFADVDVLTASLVTEKGRTREKARETTGAAADQMRGAEAKIRDYLNARDETIDKYERTRSANMGSAKTRARAALARFMALPARW
ncbi:MAG: hypothetical protein MUC88_20540 [Planctomycetes bacterium]|nr:hypothetical protein [Planctomycetota bacterium]